MTNRSLFGGGSTNLLFSQTSPLYRSSSDHFPGIFEVILGEFASSIVLRTYFEPKSYFSHRGVFKGGVIKDAGVQVLPVHLAQQFKVLGVVEVALPFAFFADGLITVLGLPNQDILVVGSLSFLGAGLAVQGEYLKVGGGT